MQRIAKFEKVSFEQYLKDFANIFNIDLIGFEKDINIEVIHNIYEKISLPKRSTVGSAGYDFVTPIDINLEPNQTITIPTGIRCKMEDGWGLFLYSRSGLGFKYRLQLNNVVGVIDSDYYGSDNEGHIIARITNCSNENKTVALIAGDRFIQGIFTPYGITEDDDADGIRDGGFGSTDHK